MSNVVEFVLKIKNLLSGGVREATTSARSDFGRLGKSISDLEQQMKALTAKRNISLDLHEVQAANREIANLQRQLNRLNGSGGGGASSGLSMGRMAKASFYGNVGAQLAMQGVGMAIDQGKEVIGGGMEAGVLKKQFGALGAGEMYGDLRKYIKDSIFGPELYDLSKTMIAYGVATKEVLPDIKMFGDITLGNVEKMKALSYAYAQTASFGKLRGNEMLQYNDAGFNPLREISRTSGIGMPALQKQMEEGKITVDMVRHSFETATAAGGKFHGMLDDMSKTSFGRKERMSGSFKDAKMALGEKFDPLIMRVMDKVEPMMDRLPAMMDKIVPVAELAFTRFEELLPSLQKLGSGVMEVLKPIGALILSDGMGKFAKSVVEVATDITDVLIPTVKPLAEVFSGVLGVVGDLIKGIREAVNYLDNLSFFSNYSHARKEREQRDIEKLNAIFAGDSAAHARGKKTDYSKTDWAAWAAARFGTSAAAMTPQKAAASFSDVNDSIVGGGRKNIHISFRNVVENMYNKGGDLKEIVDQMEPKLKEAIFRILQGIPG